MTTQLHYTYILESCSHPAKHYTGYTTDITQRLSDHNAGKCPYTAKHRPWKLVCYTAFPDKGMALAFESYLKSHSGRAFAKKHF